MKKSPNEANRKTVDKTLALLGLRRRLCWDGLRTKPIRESSQIGRLPLRSPEPGDERQATCLGTGRTQSLCVSSTISCFAIRVFTVYCVIRPEQFSQEIWIGHPGSCALEAVRAVNGDREVLNAFEARGGRGDGDSPDEVDGARSGGALRWQLHRVAR